MQTKRRAQVVKCAGASLPAAYRQTGCCPAELLSMQTLSKAGILQTAPARQKSAAGEPNFLQGLLWFGHGQMGRELHAHPVAQTETQGLLHAKQLKAPTNACQES